jgi:hypothetical protein
MNPLESRFGSLFNEGFSKLQEMPLCKGIYIRACFCKVVPIMTSFLVYDDPCPDRNPELEFLKTLWGLGTD